VRLALIAAIGPDRVIGREGALPWHISEDLKRFKALTTGSAILMGRKTRESLGRSLPNRRNVVLSRSPVPGVETYVSVPAALEALKEEERVFVIGGGQLYAATIDMADELFLTVVHRRVAGDTFFPPYEHLLGTQFVEVFREAHADYEFVDYVRAMT
jgi:dihydrofolate reductase